MKLITDGGGTQLNVGFDPRWVPHNLSQVTQCFDFLRGEEKWKRAEKSALDRNCLQGNTSHSLNALSANEDDDWSALGFLTMSLNHIEFYFHNLVTLR
jgi:hypothetical protein